MKTVGVALPAAILGYIVGLFWTMAPIELFSSTEHDTALEAAMTGAFVTGPLPAVNAVITLFVSRSLRHHSR